MVCIQRLNSSQPTNKTSSGPYFNFHFFGRSKIKYHLADPEFQTAIWLQLEEGRDMHQGQMSVLHQLLKHLVSKRMDTETLNM
jgi:hypothetical protein